MPYIGQVVHFFPRYGEGRGGKSVFPAVVLGINGDLCELMVLYDVDDLGKVPNSHRKSFRNTQHVWEFIEFIDTAPAPQASPGQASPGADLALKDQLARMQHQIDDLQGQLALMKAPGAPPPVSRKRG